MRSNHPALKVAILTFVLLILLVAAGMEFAERVVQYGVNVEREALLTQARIAAASLDPSSVSRVSGTPEELESEHYGSLKKILSRVRDSRGDLRFVYLMRLQEESLIFLVDAEPSDSPDFSPPGQVYEEADPALYEIFSTGKAVVSGPFVDRWGTWVSGFAPLHDGSGEVIAVVGIDIEAATWQQHVSTYGRFATAIVVLLAAVLVTSATGLSLMRWKAALASQREERFRMLMESAPDGIVLAGEDGRILLVNGHMETLAGHCRDDLIGQPIEMLVPDDARDGHPSQREGYLAHAQVRAMASGMSLHCQRSDGSTFPADISLSPLDTDDGRQVLAIVRDVTQRHEQEAALAAAEERSRLLLESAGEGIFGVDCEGATTFVNPAALRLLGLRADELLGKRVHALIHHHREDGSDYPVETCPMYKSFTEGEAFQVDDEVLWKKDGSALPVEYTATPIRKEGELVGAVITFQDTTQRRQAELALRRNERRTRTILETSSEGFWFVDNDLVTLEVNDAMCEILGRPRGDIENHSVVDFVDEETRHVFDQQRARQDHDGVHAYEVRLLRPDGTSVPCLFNSTPFLDEEGVKTGAFAMVTDITPQKALEEELREAKAIADEANRTKSEFLANMSHEIRTPMNAVLGFSDILRGLIAEPTQRRYLDSIRSSGRSLLGLINDILDLSKVEAGKLELEYKAVNASSVFHDMGPVFAGKVFDKGIDFRVEIDPKIPTSLILDETRLRQVLINLIGNAVKFTDAGSVTLSAHIEDVKGAHIDLGVAVTDTGVGIPVDQQDKIFGAFEQTSGQSYTKFGGTGLGLAITRQLVELMGGTIRVDSLPGEGSTFHLRLPDVEITPETSAELSTGPDIEGVRFEPATVLVADDVPANRELVRAYLEPSGLSIVEAGDGEQALARAAEQRPDLILMDIRMSVMDGYEATRRLRSALETKEIPIVILTASVMREDEAPIRAISDGYLKKPVTRTELVAELMRFLPHSEAEPTAAPRTATESPSTTRLDLDEAARGRWHELRILLGETHEQMWRQLDPAMIDEVEAFAAQMIALGTDFAYPALSQWATQLRDQAASFQLDELPATLARYEEVVQRLEEASG
jgi:PAS domain S-box-containing protein